MPRAGGDRLGVSGVGLDGSEEDGVGAEGVDVVEVLRDAVDGAVGGGVEHRRIYFVDDGVLPPEIGGDAGADPTWAGRGSEGERRMVRRRRRRGRG